MTVLQAELRAIAARLVMPEFMFTSDASNANFASTMVAEGPAMKMFERLQAEPDRAGPGRDVAGRRERDRRRPLAADMPRLRRDPNHPAVAARARSTAAKRKSIASRFTHGILSPQTWSQHLGLDYDQEQKNLATHRRGSS